MKTKYQPGEKPRCDVTKAMQKTYPRNKEICLLCKGGRLLCGLSSCPLIRKINIQGPIKERLSKDMSGPSPSVFVGWKGYPDVFVGPMTSLDPEKAHLLDDPSKWYGLDFDDIIGMRSVLVRSKKREGIHTRNRFIENSQEIALAVKPTEIETEFKKTPSYSVSFSATHQPMGPSGILERLRVTENPKIPRKVDSIVSDELRAVDMATRLYDKDFDVYYLTKVLASGVMGLNENKKIVPTKWSITAIDDMISKDQMKRIREYPSINEFQVYSNEYLYNHFEVLLMPGSWEFEQFEAWAPKTLWTQHSKEPVIQEEHELFKGRTSYAMKEAGGYYAGRIGVTEALDRMKRQARAIIFREISEGYIIPVGVWEVRENVRKAMEKKPGKFTTLKEALQDVNSRLAIPIREYMGRSEILKQRRLNEWI